MIFARLYASMFALNEKRAADLVKYNTTMQSVDERNRNFVKHSVGDLETYFQSRHTNARSPN